ncbi:NHLP bacteriocin system secretion protein [Paenibacillus sepulcri]|uniref:NHLP bacteriocin system secretion protein n=1 Tax=Paenibacillus sepulcri TaxID=359917 RepID=A0ABS7C6W5_9BACL|nr:NHLP bacteriocin system secretion protein [Paenibacillus sepulcri]
MNNDVFRKVSIERLSSPEQLDTLMKVTSPKGWLALSALGLLLVSAIVWGFYGTLNTKMQAQGVLIRPGGLQNIYSSSSGPITDIRVVENDYVHKGDVIARIEQPAMVQQLEQLAESLKAAELANQRTPSAELEEQINKIRNGLAALKTAYFNESRVVSAYTGRVLEVKVKKGASIGVGLPIITVESGEEQAKDLKTVMYVPIQEGKTIIPGMTVDISPSSVNKEEYGFLIGRVTSVSEFPVTAQTMLLTLGNEALVQELAGRGSALLEVLVDLVPDPSTISGYKWSTPKGPPQLIDSGTFTSGSITIKRQKPITSVIPQIK